MPNAGIWPGPMRTASAIWTGVAACSAGASRCRSAPPLPAQAWQAAHCRRNSPPPSATIATR